MKSILRTHAKKIQTIQLLLDYVNILFFYIVFIINDSVTFQKKDYLFVFIIFYLILKYSGLYRSYRLKSFSYLVLRIFFTSLSIFSFFFLLPFILPDFLFINYQNMYKLILIILLYLSISHIGFRYYLRSIRSKGRNSRNYIFWGDFNSLTSIEKGINDNPFLGYSLYAWFSPNNEDIQNYNNCMGGLNQIENWLSLNEKNIDCIFFDNISNDHIDISKLLEIFGNTSLPVIFSPSWASKNMKFNLSNFGDQVFLDIWGNDQDYVQKKFKQLFDFIFSFLMLIILSPVLLLIGLLIKISSKGPILFSQFRYGFNGEKFKIYKFRTMTVIDTGLETELKQVSKNDARVTKLGSFLRKWSLDELPQLLNVLKGEMSIVGPRPHAVAHNQKYRKLIMGYMQRHSFKPGISGFAQVEGFRGETKTLQEMEKRISADLYYQKNWSLRLDLKIILQTILKINSKKAY